MSRDPNPFERAARMRKATAIANVLVEAYPPVAVESLAVLAARMTAEQRENAAKIAGVPSPSADTWLEVVRILSDREQLRERIGNA